MALFPTLGNRAIGPNHAPWKFAPQRLHPFQAAQRYQNHHLRGLFYGSHNLPTLPASLNLEASSTKIEFCSSSSLEAFSTYTSGTCTLASTRTCECEASYAIRCSATCLHVTCVGTAPSPQFVCHYGTWVAPDGVNSTTLTIPSGLGTVIVSGNVSTPAITTGGLGSAIEINGCASNLSTIHVEISTTETGKLETSSLQEILSLLSSNCSVDLNNVSLSASIKGDSCKKLKVTKVISDDGSTMSGLFSIDKSGCKNRWWIILVSVICGVVLLAVIALVLMAVFWPAFREKLRPYSKARRGESNLA